MSNEHEESHHVHHHENHGQSDHDHSHAHDGEHGHSHGLVDPSIVRSREGVIAVSISLAVLLLTSLIQFGLYGITHSVALLADLIHNAGDSLTAIPLALAFIFKSKKGEHWAGYFVVFVIFLSAIVALYQVIEKFLHPLTPTNIWAIIIAGIVGVLGNLIAATIRIRAGRKLDSAALIADGIHARADGIVSFGVILGAIFIAIGIPIADPIIGLIITGLILKSCWESHETISKA